MTNDRISDTDLWQSVKHGDEKAFVSLFDRYWSKVYAISYNYLRDRDLAASVAHDVFTNLWFRKEALNITSFEPYLLKSTKYAIFRNAKRKHAEILDYSENLEARPFMSSENKGEEKIIIDEYHNQIKSHLRTLPRRCQEVFILSRFQDLSNDEIATKLKISKRTVENQITFALKHLKIRLKELLIVMMLIYQYVR